MATTDKQQQIEYHLNCVRILINSETTRTNDLEKKTDVLGNKVDNFSKRFELLERKVDALFKKLDCIRSLVNNLKQENADMSWLSEFSEEKQVGDNNVLNIDVEIDLDVGNEVEIT